MRALVLSTQRSHEDSHSERDLMFLVALTRPTFESDLQFGGPVRLDAGGIHMKDVRDLPRLVVLRE